MVKYISFLIILSFTLFAQTSFAKKDKKIIESCTSFAGTMSQDSVVVCAGEDISSQAINWQNDGNDTLVYYLHEGNTDSIVNPIDSNFTGIFSSSKIKFNKLYFISSVVADTNSTNWINLNDACKSVNIGTPVIWLKTSVGKKQISTCRDYFPLNAKLSMLNSSVKWSSSDALSLKFTTANDSISTHLIETAQIDAQNKSVIIYFEENNEFCTLKDSFEIMFTDSILADFTYQQAKCYQNQSKNPSSNFIFNAIPDSLSEYYWNFHNATIVNTSSDLDSDTCNVYWKKDSIHIISFVASNCPFDTIVKIVTEPAKLDVFFNTVSATCHNNNGEIVAHPVKAGLPYYQYDTLYWQANAQILNPLDTIQMNMYAGKYRINMSNELCKAVVYATVKDSGLVKAKFTPSLQTAIAEKDEIKFTNNSYTYDDDENQANDNIPDSAIWILQKMIRISSNSIMKNDTIYTNFLEPINYTYQDSGHFPVKMIAISKEGCRDTSDIQFIDVEYDSKLGGGTVLNGIPNVFTPNGDLANDVFTFEIQSLEYFECDIYNRWGNKVYHFDNDKQDGWDGTIFGATLAPAGTYYYVIKGKGKDGTIFREAEEINKKAFKREVLIGYITLIRNQPKLKSN